MSPEYHRILKEEDASDGDEGNPHFEGLSRKHTWIRSMAPMLWVAGSLFAMVAMGLYVFASSHTSHCFESLTYSPAQEAVRYVKTTWPDAFVNQTKFMGKPTPELDANWEAEYDLISRLPKWQADKLDPPSAELPNDPGYYPVMLNIFHSLHCLNDIRKTLDPGYYGDPLVRHNATEEMFRLHLNHCVEHLRLALWCNADISPIPFHFTEHGLNARHEYPHTCKDKDALLEWARKNQVLGMF